MLQLCKLCFDFITNNMDIFIILSTATVLFEIFIILKKWFDAEKRVKELEEAEKHGNFTGKLN